MPDYSKGKIYKIVCNTTGLKYIGSTCETKLCRRLAKHRGNYNDWVKKNDYANYMTSFEILKNNDYEIILIKDYPCETKEQLLKKERYYIQKYKCVNKNIPITTKEEKKEKKKEYAINNKEQIEEYKKNYYVKNKELIKEYREANKDVMKQYYESNKERINKIYHCICGIEYTYGHKSRHFKSKKHLNFVTN